MLMDVFVLMLVLFIVGKNTAVRGKEIQLTFVELRIDNDLTNL